ncbi:hypothetical protein [Zavarzinella formosa]|uniref:hypothetical protein n=1 Tax=Zavarzinella formosa TaxID=360055 RepID=UPI0002D7BAEF|nr:hypothetical protein [Zavarzinella formosa]
MRMLPPILAVIATALLVTPAFPQDKKNPSEESDKRIKQLQKERLENLKKVSEGSFVLAKGHRMEIAEALEATMDVFRAEMEAAEKETDRIAICNKTVDLLKQYEELAKARHEAARGTEVGVFRARSKRLEVEICLERAKAKEAGQGK